MEDKQGVLFSNLFRRPVTAVFDSPQSSSDGGSLLLKACDAALGMTETLASWLRDGRQPGKVVHGVRELLRQRVFAIACGYADGNDASRLRRDPVFKLLAGRDPDQGRDLASQPTLSRFENSIRRRDLLEAAKAFAAAVIERQRRRRKGVKQIVIDFDPTCDPTHGGQQLSLFNHFYDTACYLPLVVFLTFDNEREQYLVCAALRAGNAPAKQGVAGILKRLLPMLREAFPKARLRVRLDAGFAGPELLEAFEREGLEYVMCLAGNPTLKRAAAGLMEPVWKEYEQTGKRPQERYGDCLYGARSWKRRRRGGDAGRPGTAAGAQAEGKPAVRGDQRQGRSAADLPTDLLSARRSGEPHQGTQGGRGDGPGELHEFLCEPVPRAVVGGGLCLAAGVAVAGSGDPLRQDAGGRAATVPAEAGGVGEEFDAAGRAEPAQGGAIRVGVAADCQESGSGADLAEPGADRQRREGEQRGGECP